MSIIPRPGDLFVWKLGSSRRLRLIVEADDGYVVMCNERDSWHFSAFPSWRVEQLIEQKRWVLVCR